ncbi:hypothetical protein BGX26_002898 [Mortierella sp. AD094]|nr:hypothetical protein BGX26_002898 [Mortierella sp. AD094]
MVTRNHHLASFLVLVVLSTAAAATAVTEPGTKAETRTRTISGWPKSLEIEIEKLEIGGLSLPLTQSLIKNVNTGFKNFGNIEIIPKNVVVAATGGKQSVEYGS